MSTPLEKARTKPAAGLVVDTPLKQRRLSIARGENVTLPQLGPAYMRLIPHTQGNDVESETFQEMARIQLAPNSMTAWSYALERSARILARAVRDPSNHELPFGTLEQWLDLDEDLIQACDLIYQDIRNRLDPVGLATLTTEDLEEIRRAIEKKNQTALLACGVAKLSLYLLTTGAQPSTSPTPPSSTGGSSPE